jgi:hypothetical protein
MSDPRTPAGSAGVSGSVSRRLDCTQRTAHTSSTRSERLRRRLGCLARLPVPGLHRALGHLDAARWCCWAPPRYCPRAGR